jgi:outer membrane receptor protein involved in Fe transport
MHLSRLLPVGLLVAFSALAQTVTGRLEGRVRDAGGAMVVRAQITARNQETGLERETATNEEGFYRFDFLPLGSYTVRAGFQGFQTVEKSGVLIELNKATVSDFTLEVSPVSEQVTVEGEAPQIEMTSGEVKGAIEQSTVESTPLSGRNFLSLMELVPEFQLAAFSTSANNPTLSTGSYASFSGTGTRSTTFQIDGVNNDDSSENQNRQGVNVSAIRAVQVVTNSYSAEFGRGAGGVVLIQTKNGSNRFHGDAYEYLQNEKLSSNSFFGNAAGRRADGSLVSPISPTKRNQFGFTLGGPLVKNRAFFFGSFEQTRFRQFAVITKDIFLPSEQLQVGECDLCLRPAEHPNLQADLKFLQSVMDRFPKQAPNNFAQPGGRAYTAQAHHDFPDQDYSGRVDLNLRQQDSLVLRYQYSRQKRFPGEIILGETARQNNKQQAVGATLTHVYSPSQVGEFRFGLGLRTTLVNISSGNDTPVIRFTNSPCCGSIIGNAGAFPINRRQNDYQYVYNHSKIGPRQTFRFGTDLRRSHLDDFSDNFSRRFWTFGVTPASSTSRGYTAYENFLRGLVTTFQKGFGQFYLENRLFEQNYFFQDDLRLRPNLTLNLGARYEYVASPSDVRDRIRYGYGADRNNLEPRFGFAWSPAVTQGWRARLTGGAGKSVVRGGYGIFHARIFQSLFSQGGANLRAQPPNGILRSWINTFNVADPTEGFVFQPGFPTGRISILQVDPGFHLPYTQQGNLTVERQLPAKLAVSLGYRWVRGLGLAFYQWTNRARFPLLSPVDGVLYDKIDSNLGNTTPAPGFISAAQPRTDQRRPDTRYTNLLIASNGAWSYYNAMILTVSKRLSHGFHFSSYYTFSKTMDTGSEATSTGDDTNAGITEFDSFRSLRGLSAFHSAHRFVLNGSWRLPLKGVLGGWILSGTYTAASGQPFTVTAGYDYNADGLANDRPVLLDNRLLGTSVDNGRVDPATGIQHSVNQLPVTAFSPNYVASASVAARPFAPGTAGEGSIGRNTFFLHGMNNFDVAVHKSFAVREGHSLIFRTELYNLLNRVQFGGPSRSVLVSNFGRIASQRNPTNYVGAGRFTGARFFQFALRYVF